MARNDKEAAASDGESSAHRIVQLEEAVINRIAAGEVVVRPANALKELMENCIDAGSRHIVVQAKSGGMKMLRIEDDGHGIRKDDLPILCERFTTSKLRQYEDLESIGTFGFRGEALASISHVGHVTVTTMTRGDSMASMAEYTDGKLRAPPRPCAGTVGTTIVVEDLFYNNTTRRQALAKDSVEHAKILEVMQKYSIHYPRVSFTCRKANSSVAELHTLGGDTTLSLDVVGLVYGQGLVRELISFGGGNLDPKFEFRGLASGPNWTSRSMVFTLFINNRLVECPSLKRAIEAAYAPLLPRHQHPWVYLALDLDPSTIDVNVHPTKMEVQFLNEETIAHAVHEALLEQLKSRGGSRTFSVVTPTPATTPFSASLVASIPIAPQIGSTAGADAGGASRVEAAEDGLALSGISGGRASVANTMPPVAKAKAEALNPTRVRTDFRQRSLQSLWRDSQATQASARTSSTGSATPIADAASAGDAVARGAEACEGAAGEYAGDVEGGGRELPTSEEVRQDAERQAAFDEAQQLTSISELKRKCANSADATLSKSLAASVYVGPVSRELALVQCGAALCLVNLARLARDCAYQRLLRHFGGVQPIVLRPSLPLVEVLYQGILDPGSGYDPDGFPGVDPRALADEFAARLVEKAEMLAEYIGLDLAGGSLAALPNALCVTSDAGLSLDGLPLFLVRLAVETNWSDEQLCFEGLCRVTADFAMESLLPDVDDAELADTKQGGAAAAAVAALNAAVEAGDFEDVAAAAEARKKRSRTAAASPGTALEGLRWLHEAMMRDGACQWPAEYSRDGTVIELVSLNQLYRIFERC